MLPRKIFENLHAGVAILALFEQFLDKFCLNFLPLKSECFTKYDAFCSYIFDYACLGCKAYCYRKGSKLWKKLYSSKTCLKVAGGGMHPPWIRPCPP